MLSYSGLTNYGKSTLPSVKGWNGTLNIMRDPPKSIYTRRIERVGDTNDVMNTLAHSQDRFIECINNFARGVNPMVSVTYGEGQTANQTSNRGQSYLPYRIIKDGAFRPPIRVQEDLLPLSRLPRTWTTVESNPSIVDFTKRLIEIGTCETTPQVRDEIRTIACETRKLFNKEPDIVPPNVESRTRNNLLSVNARTYVYEPQVEIISERPSYDRLNSIVWAFGTTTEYMPSYEPIRERPRHFLNDIRTAAGYTNPIGVDERPLLPDEPIILESRYPLASGRTYPLGTDEKPIVPEIPITLESNKPPTSGYTYPVGTDEKPRVPESMIDLEHNLPQTEGYTNPVGTAEKPRIPETMIPLEHNLPAMSGYTNPVGIDEKPGVPEMMVELEQNLPAMSGYAKPTGIDEKPRVPEMMIDLETNLPAMSGYAKPTGIDEKPMVPEINVELYSKIPQHSGHTNAVGIASNAHTNTNFDRLPGRVNPGGFDGRPVIPKIIERDIPVLRE